jgi:predicted peptidase
MIATSRLLLGIALLLACTLPGIAQEKKRKSRSMRFEPEYTSRTFKGTNDGELTYGWLAPLQAKEGEKYPLVVCLHGAGGSVSASAVLAQKGMREKYPAFVMVPKAELPFAWAKAEIMVRRRPDAGDVKEKLPVLMETIQSLLKSESVDPTRVYVLGQSMGGFGSWGAIARHPAFFAAAAPVCGGWDIADAPKMVPVPVWAFHGADDKTVPVQLSRDMTAALTNAGGTVKYTEYPGVDHDSWTKAFADPELWTWLFAQKKMAATR